jgi:integrase
MARPFKKRGRSRWYARVKDGAGRWRDVPLAEARTKADAERLAGDLAMRERRVRDGLDPLPPDRTFTVGKLLRWWLETWRKGAPSQRQEEDRFRYYFEESELAALPVVGLTSGRIEAFLNGYRERLGASSRNHLRAMLRTAWNRARRAGLVSGINPAVDVKPAKVPKRAPAFLEGHEVDRLLAELQEGDCWMVATMVYAGLRKGEMYGLRKADVDLGRRLLMVRRSYDRETTKGASEEAVPIAPPLVPYLEAAMEAAKGDLLFPKAGGSMRTENDALGERLRRALGRAGIVSGYVHTCRRCKARGHPQEERHSDNTVRKCPACGMLLWAKPLPKQLRVHDLRHTTATLLLAAGADPWAVAKILRHSDPTITFRVYAHLVPGYLQDQVQRLAATGCLDRDQGTNEDAVSGSSLREGANVREPGNSVPIRPYSAPLADALLTRGGKQLAAPPRDPEIASVADVLGRRAWQESNLRPAASKAAALSS